MYQVALESQAQRDIRGLPRSLADRVIAALTGLKDNPRPPGCRKLTGSQSDWRIRIGDYRVVYQIDDKAKAVRVYYVRHRRDAYR